ncbi:MAG: response regulator [Polyangiaceae bacterium]
MTELAPSAATVVVVDDDVSVRESVADLMRSAGYTVQAYASATEFLHSAAVRGPSCLVLDVELPDLSGLDLQARLGAGQARSPIVFVTGHGDIPMTVRAMKAGAVEFLTKPFDDEALLGAVRTALSRSQAALLADAEGSLLRERFESLTPREREVMALVASGLANKQIAAQLGTAEITVKGHRGRAMHKMSAASLAELVRMADALALPRTQRPR